MGRWRGSPVPVGECQFVFEAPAPNPASLPPQELVGVTVVLITCSYEGKEFVRVGYYVNNDFFDPALREAPPTAVPPAELVTMLHRTILDKPRVTRYEIPWDTPAMATGQENLAPFSMGAVRAAVRRPGSPRRSPVDRARPSARRCPCP